MTDRLAAFLDAINTELRPGAATIAGYDPETLPEAGAGAEEGPGAPASDNADETSCPAIIRACKNCRVTDAEIASGYVVVSPSGLAHHGVDYGTTACGHDATGDHWWWPL